MVEMPFFADIIRSLVMSIIRFRPGANGVLIANHFPNLLWESLHPHILWEGGTDLDISYSVLMEFQQRERVMGRDEHCAAVKLVKLYSDVHETL